MESDCVFHCCGQFETYCGCSSPKLQEYLSAWNLKSLVEEVTINFKQLLVSNLNLKFLNLVRFICQLVMKDGQMRRLFNLN